MKFFPSVVADAAIFLFLSSAVFAQHYTQVNLDANVTGAAEAADPQLVNAWGLARSSGSTWWVSDEATGFATLYNGPAWPGSISHTLDWVAECVVADPSQNPRSGAMTGWSRT